MFREMRRIKQQITTEECIEVLTKAPRGVLSVHGEDGYPYAFPMNHFYLDGKLYFHCAVEGHKLDALNADNRVCFCAMDEGFRNEGEWALNIKSVIAFGQIHVVENPQELLPVLRQLGQKHYPTPESVEKVIDKHFSRLSMMVMTIDHMTGKRVNES